MTSETRSTNTPIPTGTTASSLVEQSAPFLRWLQQWYDGLQPLSLRRELAEQQLSPDAVAVISVDMVRGFAKEGPLCSPRISALIPTVVGLMQRFHDAGVPHFVLAQDTHAPNTPEFKAFPPHCIAGTREAEMIPELRALPFAQQFVVIPKNSLSISIGTEFGAWLANHPNVRAFFIVGDCTDLCVYQAAMHLRLWANAMNLERRVVVPADAVQTYDLPVEGAPPGALPHPGDLLHALFLYHMALNGIVVVRSVTD